MNLNRLVDEYLASVSDQDFFEGLRQAGFKLVPIEDTVLIDSRIQVLCDAQQPYLMVRMPRVFAGHKGGLAA